MSDGIGEKPGAGIIGSGESSQPQPKMLSLAEQGDEEKQASGASSQDDGSRAQAKEHKFAEQTVYLPLRQIIPVRQGS